MTPRRPPAPDHGSPGSRGTGRQPGHGAVHGPARLPARSRPVQRPKATVRQQPHTSVRAGSGRPLWLLGAVGVLLAVLILPYFQKWLVQRSQLETARSQVAQTRRDVASLGQQRARWQDDDYVRAQARKRLNYVLPGEIGFVVLDPRTRTTSTDPRRAAAVPHAGSPWYDGVWASARVAGGGADGGG